MKYTEKYKCNLCGTLWLHEWDTEDYNNDYAQCPNCFEINFEEIEIEPINLNHRIKLKEHYVLD